MNVKKLTRQLSIQETREAVNENFSALALALEKKLEIVVGTYTGDGKCSQAIVLGFTPLFVMVVESACGARLGSTCCGGFALQGSPMRFDYLCITADGFQVQNGFGGHLNDSGGRYQYLAVKMGGEN